MSSVIIAIGNISDLDRSVIEKVSVDQGFIVKFLSTIDANTTFSPIPSGFLSFNPPTIDSVTSLFCNLPIGTGEKIPFFQAIESDQIPDIISKFPIKGVFKTPLSLPVVYNMMNSISRNDSLNLQINTLVKELINHRKQKFQLVQIGTSLSREDNLMKLLEFILSACRQIASADAGCIYIRERKVPGGPFLDRLKFMISQNDSIEIGSLPVSISIPIDETSIPGSVAMTERTLNIDFTSQDENTQSHNPVCDEIELLFGYCIKTMLVIPLKNLEGEVVGILKLTNKKKDGTVKLLSPEDFEKNVIEFSSADEEFIQSIASQAAVSIERVQLHENINAIFEGFLNSSIAAIDERDRVTSGHSRRVMGLATAFVNAAQKEPDSVFSQIARSPEQKRQFEFAALLHDIGKVGVPEPLLVKESRISDDQLNAIFLKMDLVAFHLKYSSSFVSWKNIDEVYSDRDFLKRINYASFLSDEDLQKLNQIKDKIYTTIDGSYTKLLSEKEYEALSIRTGNLTIEERNIINSHAKSTFKILSKIPWPRSLENLPVIASQHHEKLDGSGYPDGLKTDDIMLESKILAVIDIYEALVSQERKYKPKMEPEAALEILRKEVERGRLDKDVLDFFIEKKIYKLYKDYIA